MEIQKTSIAKLVMGTLACISLTACTYPGFKSNSDPFGLNCKESRIVGGRSILPGQDGSKDAVLLLIKRGDKVSSCTGAPVTSRLILTAAHCVAGAPQDGIRAVFHTDMRCASGYSREKAIASSSHITHAEYDGKPQSMADLALVKLSESIPVSYPIQGFYDGNARITDDEVLLLGFGITDETKTDSLELRTTTKSFSKDMTIKKQIIGIRQNSRSGGFCRGDSGAPIYIKIGGQKKIIGVNSFNLGTAKNNECHTASVGMYVPYFGMWLKNKILDL